MRFVSFHFPPQNSTYRLIIIWLASLYQTLFNSVIIVNSYVSDVSGVARQRLMVGPKCRGS